MKESAGAFLHDGKACARRAETGVRCGEDLVAIEEGLVRTEEDLFQREDHGLDEGNDCFDKGKDVLDARDHTATVETIIRDRQFTTTFALAEVKSSRVGTVTAPNAASHSHSAKHYLLWSAIRSIEAQDYLVTGSATGC